MIVMRAAQRLSSRPLPSRGLRFASGSSSTTTFDNVLVERRERVGIVTLNRPKVTRSDNWCSFRLPPSLCRHADYDMNNEPHKLYL